MKGTVKKWGINGEGIVFLHGKAIFVPGAIPGETIEYELRADHDTWAEGVLKEVIEPSARRRHPLCRKWQECGGCSLMHLDYKGQVRMKEQVLKDTLRKYAGYEGSVEPLMKNPEPLAYRNACKMPFGLDEEGRPVSGMYARGSHTFVPVERCLVHSRKLEQVRQEINRIFSEMNLPVTRTAAHPGYMTLVLKEFNGKVHIVLVTSDLEVPQELADRLMEIDGAASAWQSIKTPEDPEHELFGSRVLHLAGDMKMTLQLEDLHLTLLPRSFFQLNTAQATQVYKKVLDWLPEHCGLMVEAYSGIGAISLMAADRADEIIGIETIEDAVANAADNALINGCSNVSFRCDDAAEGLQAIVEEKTPDVLVVDPPRTGLDTPMKETLRQSGIPRVIYVSCNPSTLAKDIRDLSGEYVLRQVVPVDMFSQTPNIESISLLERMTPAEQETARKRKEAQARKSENGQREKKPDSARETADRSAALEKKGGAAEKSSRSARDGRERPDRKHPDSQCREDRPARRSQAGRGSAFLKGRRSGARFKQADGQEGRRADGRSRRKEKPGHKVYGRPEQNKRGKTQ